ncbi:MAG: glycosyltransferase [Firmicutes bacterium]|nr:glycosyltransferase [Bacillota bacterium]
MRVLFVDSGALGFHTRYAYDIYTSLINDFHFIVKQIHPQNLTQYTIRDFQPDVLLVVHGSRTPLTQVRYARTLGIITVLWLVEDPYEIDFHRGIMVNSFDLVFTNERQAVNEYTHPRVTYLPWCCNPRIHKKMNVSDNYRSDLCFVGMGFPNRVRILNSIASVLKPLNVKLIGEWNRWERLDPSLRDFVLPVVNDFREVLKYYNGAKINLNIHRDPVDPPSGNSRGVAATSPNDRTFAIAGCGGFQLVDRSRPDLWDCFQDQQEIVAFSDPDDLAQKIQFYLGESELRERIGFEAQKRAYRDHTYKSRLREIFRQIRSLKPGNVGRIIPNSRFTHRTVFYEVSNSGSWPKSQAVAGHGREFRSQWRP